MSLKYTGGQVDRVYSAQLNNMAYANKNAVLTGCEVSESSPAAMTIDVTSGNMFFGNDTIAVTADADVAISSNATSYTRLDLVAVDATGTISIIEGAASSLPTTPDYDPDDYIILAIVTVAAGASSIVTANIQDIRVLNEGGSGSSGSGGIGRVLETFTSQTSVTVTHNLADNEPIVYVYEDSTEELIIPQDITITDENELVVTFSTSTSGRIVVYGGVGRGNSYYSEDFTSATSWVVSHNLGRKYVQVQCYNSSDELIEPSSITLDSDIQCTIAFGVATAGRVVVTGGASENTFLKMTDTPSSFSGQAGKFLAVNSGEDAVEFKSVDRTIPNKLSFTLDSFYSDGKSNTMYSAGDVIAKFKLKGNTGNAIKNIAINLNYYSTYSTRPTYLIQYSSDNSSWTTMGTEASAGSGTTPGPLGSTQGIVDGLTEEEYYIQFIGNSQASFTLLTNIDITFHTVNGGSKTLYMTSKTLKNINGSAATSIYSGSNGSVVDNYVLPTVISAPNGETIESISVLGNIVYRIVSNSSSASVVIEYSTDGSSYSSMDEANTESTSGSSVSGNSQLYGLKEGLSSNKVYAAIKLTKGGITQTVGVYSGHIFVIAVY